MDYTDIIIKNIISALNVDKKIYPQWPEDLVHQMAMVDDKSGEALKATLQHVYEGRATLQEIEHGLREITAKCIRMMEHLYKLYDADTTGK